MSDNIFIGRMFDGIDEFAEYIKDKLKIDNNVKRKLTSALNKEDFDMLDNIIRNYAQNNEFINVFGSGLYGIGVAISNGSNIATLESAILKMKDFFSKNNIDLVNVNIQFIDD